MTVITGLNGANGTSGLIPTAGKNGAAATNNSNGMIGADSNTVGAIGGNGGTGGTNTGTGPGAAGGNGGAATTALNGNIYTPLGSSLVVNAFATGGNGGLGGPGTPGGAQGNGGNATVNVNGNIISTNHALSQINISAIATAGSGTKSGNATSTVNGNIITYNASIATDVVLNSEAVGPGEIPGNTGSAFGTKVANLNGNILNGNINNVSLFASAFYANSTATINGNIITTKPANTGTVLAEAMGQNISINGNIFNLGKQNVVLALDELGPQYSATVAGNIFNGTGVNGLTIQETWQPGPNPHPDTVNINLGTNSFTFNGQNNIINNFANITLGAGVQGTIAGNNNANTLTGGSGNDYLSGLGGMDTLNGAGGNDILFGGTGNDTLNGGTGTNVAYFSGSEWQYSSVSLTAVNGGPDGNDTMANIQRLKFLSPSHVSDFNNDGYGDLLFQDTATADNRIELSNGALPSPIMITPLTGWKTIGTGQFTADTDRNAGILLQNTTTGELEVITAVTSGAPVTSAFTGGPITPATFTGWTAVTAGDFNGDAASDVLLQQGAGGPVEIAFLNINSGEPIGQVDAITAVTAPGANWNAISSGDFNADGYSDILWQNSTTGALDVSLMTGASGTPITVGNPGTNFAAVGTGDFNNDGKSDILLRNNTTGDAQIWLMNGTTQIGSPVTVTGPGAGWTLLGAEDVNKDGFSDLLWQNTASGAVDVQAMTIGATTLGSLTTLTTPPAGTFHLIASTGGG